MSILLSTKYLQDQILKVFRIVPEFRISWIRLNLITSLINVLVILFKNDIVPFKLEIIHIL